MNRQRNSNDDLLAVFRNSGVESEDLEFEAGTVLCSHGMPASGLLLIISGHARTFVPVSDRQELHIDQVGPGESIGLAAILSGRNSEVSAVARSTVRAVLIRRDQVLSALRANPQLYMHVNKCLSEAVSTAYNHVREMRLST